MLSKEAKRILGKMDNLSEQLIFLPLKLLNPSFSLLICSFSSPFFHFTLSKNVHLHWQKTQGITCCHWHCFLESPEMVILNGKRVSWPPWKSPHDTCICSTLAHHTRPRITTEMSLGWLSARWVKAPCLGNSLQPPKHSGLTRTNLQGPSWTQVKSRVMEERTPILTQERVEIARTCHQL